MIIQNKPNLLTTAETEALPPPVDLEHIYDAMGEQTSEILGLCLTGISRDLVRLADAIQANNISEVDLIAHNCAGTSATCGMTAIVPAFRQLEQAAREGNLHNAPAFLDDAKIQFDRILSFLKAEYLV